MNYPRTADGAEIDLGDILLRRWRLDDAEALSAAVAANLEHLRPWMPWIAEEPITLEARRALLGRWVEQWDVGGDRNWGIFQHDRVLGSCGMMSRLGPGAVEIGYWLDAASEGRGVMTRTVSALTTLAFAHPGVDRVEIHHDGANVRSGRIPERLGFTLIDRSKVAVTAPGERGICVSWRVTRAEWVKLSAPT